MWVETVSTFQKYIEKISDWIWGYPMLAFLLGVGIFFTFQLRFLPFLNIHIIFSETVGKLFRKRKEKGKTGTLSPFQAFTTSLASTAGATNIIGVPIAIAFGGPGALFWMWVVAFIGMSVIYAEIVLGLKYREKKPDGEWVGGPVYYMQKALNWKVLSIVYASGLLVEVFVSSMVQTNSATEMFHQSFGTNRSFLGIGLVILVALIVFGGVKRIGRVMEKLLPFLVLLYIILCVIIIFSYRENLLTTLSLIFTHAFSKTAALGLFPGATLIQAMRWGMARGLYTSETGMGTTAIANATAEVEYPPQQAFWGIIAVITDTLIICTLSGLVVLVTGAWNKLQPTQAPLMIIEAFRVCFGNLLGSSLLCGMVTLFVLATVGVIIYYGEKQAQFLFTKKIAFCIRLVYLSGVYLGSIGALVFVWKLTDLVLVLLVVPNLLALLFLHREVREETSRYLEKRASG